MKVHIFGVAIDSMTLEDARDRMRTFLRDGRQHSIVTPNPEILLLARKDKEFHRILNEADLSLPDGVGLLFASRLLGQSLKERITGVRFAHLLCDEAVRANAAVFLFGSGAGVARRAGERLRALYPALRIIGTESGGVIERIAKSHWRYEDTSVPATIRQAKPDILFVALGQGKQEKWIADNLQSFPSVKIAMGVGGALDYIAGAASWAPPWVREVGLEWLWRLTNEPRRWRRIFNAVIVFPLVVLYEKYKTR